MTNNYTVETKKILRDLKYELRGHLPEKIAGITDNSRDVKKGFAFIAVKGLKHDGHNFISDVIQKEPSLLIVEKFIDNVNVPQIKVKNTRSALSKIAANFYDNPSKKLKIIGVTGTNGKTTTIILLSNILRKAGYTAETIGTLGYTLKGENYKLGLTTPDSLQIQSILNRYIKNKIEYVVMEVSSHSLALHRVDSIKFDFVIFTNISQDHLDFHKTIEDYVKAKLKLFEMPNYNKYCLINIDDRFFKIFIKGSRGKVYTYSLYNSNADFKWSVSTTYNEGINGIIESGSDKITIKSALSGKFNLYNILAASSCARLIGLDKEIISSAILDVKNIPGRFQEFRIPGKPRIIIDYAHTPDAFENVLSSIINIKNKNGKLITVFGCGGNRDRKKRPKMAKIAEKYSDFCIVTNDNPRFENPDLIINDIMAGFKNKNLFTVIKDRKEAITHAIKISTDNDIIAILGKGHEDYQEINGVRSPFSDLEVVKNILKE